MNCLRRWYHEGILATPPPCLYNSIIRKYLSLNTFCGPISCISVGKWGFRYGEKYRSELMFIAFWASFISIILLIIPFCSLSYIDSTIINTYWVKGTSVLSKTSLPSYEYSENTYIAYYFGLRHVAVTCDGPACDYLIDNSIIGSYNWVNCPENELTAVCTDCSKTSTETLLSAIFGLLTMIPQITTNLQRSQEQGDLHCQKWWGMFTSFLGFVSAILTLKVYLSGCFFYLDDTINNTNITIEYSYGPSVYCNFFAGLFKIYDVAVNFMVPVPIKGYWKDETSEIENDGGNHDENNKNDTSDKVAATYIEINKIHCIDNNIKNEEINKIKIEEL